MSLADSGNALEDDNLTGPGGDPLEHFLETRQFPDATNCLERLNCSQFVP